MIDISLDILFFGVGYYDALKRNRIVLCAIDLYLQITRYISLIYHPVILVDMPHFFNCVFKLEMKSVFLPNLVSVYKGTQILSPLRKLTRFLNCYHRNLRSRIFLTWQELKIVDIQLLLKT